MTLAWVLRDGLIASVPIGASGVEQDLATIRNLQFSKEEFSQIGAPPAETQPETDAASMTRLRLRITRSGMRS
jgi:hypothetical protein